MFFLDLKAENDFYGVNSAFIVQLIIHMLQYICLYIHLFL